MTHFHNREVNTKHQERSALHHILCDIQEIQEYHNNITCGMHNPIKKVFPQKGRIRKRLGAKTILLGYPNPDFIMKDNLGSMSWCTQGQQRT